MRIVAALPWYDEPPAFLDRCVRSLAGVADHLVAVDGRWDMFDDGAPILSPWQQPQAIGKAADAIGLDHHVWMGPTVWQSQVAKYHHVWMGPTVWQSQVAKRAALMELAAEQGDWVLVIDADEYVMSSYPGMLRPALKETTHDVATVLCTHAGGERRPPARIRRIFRAGTTVQTAHNGYRYHDRWLHGDSARVRLEPAVDVSGWLELHDVGSVRDDARMQKKRDYSRARQRLKVESWR